MLKRLQETWEDPHLENRTGRFAESVNIASGSTGTQYIWIIHIIHYTECLKDGENIHQTMTQEPLIEKSIRELAAARLETKFTLRRV